MVVCRNADWYVSSIRSRRRLQPYNHTPSLFYKTASEGISKEVSKYIDELIEDRPGKVLSDAIGIRNGEILDQRIIAFQGR